jgi:cytidine deaminase
VTKGIVMNEKQLEKCHILAQQTANKAYAPYSNFHVGCVLLGSNGEFYCGCNVENASYGQSQCAEASAIGNLITDGCRDILQVVLYTPTEQFCWPCGGCRQRLWEFASTETPVISYNAKGKYEMRNLGNLLPDSFGKSNLEK